MLCNPSLFMHLLKVVQSCETADQLKVACDYVQMIYDRPFCLTIFEYTELTHEAIIKAKIVSA